MKYKNKFFGLIIGLLLLISIVNASSCSSVNNGTYITVTCTGTGNTTWDFNLLKITNVLIIGGGGSGGGGQLTYAAGGGGGAGGYLEGTVNLTGVYTITVGQGGSAVPAQTTGNNGNFSMISNSSINFTALGGGGGGKASSLGSADGNNGGSGGGGGGGGVAKSGGSSTQTNIPPLLGYGNSGGSSLGAANSGGGGGAGGAGGLDSPGAGKVSFISGASYTYSTGGYGGESGVSTGYGAGGSGNADTPSGAGTDGIIIFVYPVSYETVTAFTASPSSGTIPLNVSFTDLSSNGPTSWNWSFGDGTYNDTQNPVHTYSIAGSYTVILTTSNIFGYSNFSSTITALPSTPIASFTINPNVGVNPLSVTFTDTSSGSITGWSWSFGDGGSSTLQNPIYSYSNLGTYYPKLSVTSSVGDNLSAQSTPIYVIISAVPLVDFTGTPTTGTAPLSVQFTDYSVALNGVTGWNWSFGDGNYSNLQNPVHIYPNTGQYSITLVATSSDSFSNYTSKVGYINVGVPSSTVSASFVANQTIALTYPAAIQFTDTSVCNPLCTQWAWDLNNDGSTDSVSQNPLYIYNYPGNYSPKLITSNGINSGTKVMSLYITIGPIFVKPTITQPTEKWVPGYRDDTTGSIYSFRGDTSIDLANSTYLKYWLQNFTATGNFSIYGFAIALTAPIMHVFGFWIYLIIWGLYLFAVWIRSQDVTLPLIIGILSMGTFGLLFPKESLPVIIVMFVICGAIIITKLMKDSI